MASDRHEREMAERRRLVGLDPSRAKAAESGRAPGEPLKRIEVLRGHMAAGRWREALKLAASWQQLGDEAKAIRQGWEGYARPDFQRQLRRDPEALTREGQAALVRRYGKPVALENGTTAPMQVAYADGTKVAVPCGGSLRVWHRPDGKYEPMPTA